MAKSFKHTFLYKIQQSDFQRRTEYEDFLMTSFDQ